jgi:energy-coupling factor transporter transmembrane protein EcfT
MEPDWMTKISSVSICSFYYAFFVAYAVVAVIAIIGLVLILFTKLPLSFKLSLAFQSLINIALGILLALFQYMVCDRALLGSEAQRAEMRNRE